MARTKNPAAKAVRSPQFRPRAVKARKGTKAYRRRPKHRPEAKGGDPEDAPQ